MIKLPFSAFKDAWYARGRKEMAASVAATILQHVKRYPQGYPLPGEYMDLYRTLLALVTRECDRQQQIQIYLLESEQEGQTP